MNVNGFMFKLLEKNKHSTIYTCENRYTKKCKATYKLSSIGDVNITAHSSACKLANKKYKNFDTKSYMTDGSTAVSLKSSLEESLSGIYRPFTPDHSSICTEELSSVFPVESQDVGTEFKSPLPRAKNELQMKTEIFKIVDKPVLQFLPAIEKKFCRYCKVKILGRIRLRKHQQKCPLMDLCRDPCRNKVTSVCLRPGRIECDKCLQRFWGKVGRHRCEHTSGHRLCIWCDKYKKCPKKHRNKCRYRRIFLDKKFFVVNFYERAREIFQKRHVNYIFSKKEEKHDRPRPTEWTPELIKIAAFYGTEDIEVAKKHYHEWKSDEWTQELRRIAEIYQTFDIQVARKHYRKSQGPYHIPGFCYFSNEGPMILNPSPIQPHHLKIPPNEKEREALVGLKSIDDDFRETIESTTTYRQLSERTGGISLTDSEKHEIFLQCALWHPYIDRMGGAKNWFLKKRLNDEEPTSVFKLRKDPELQHLKKPVFWVDPAIREIEEEEGEITDPIMFFERMFRRQELTNLIQNRQQKQIEKLQEPEEIPEEVREEQPELEQIERNDVDEDDEILVMATPRREDPETISEEEEEEREFVFSRFNKNDKDEMKKVLRTYKECFLNFNKKMEKWIKKHETWCMYKSRELVGCCTLKMHSRKRIDFLNVLILCVDQKNQGGGIGRRIIDEIKKICPVIILWSDVDASGFYRKNGFDFVKPVGSDPKDFNLIEFENEADLMMHWQIDRDLKALGLMEDTKRQREYFCSLAIPVKMKLD
jgi:N-acetylglutamate synthase-like GNAT family acetyltransferase